MYRLEATTTNGTFTVGKLYFTQEMGSSGTPILLDDTGASVDIWDYTNNYLPACWVVPSSLTPEELVDLNNWILLAKTVIPPLQVQQLSYKW